MPLITWGTCCVDAYVRGDTRPCTLNLTSTASFKNLKKCNFQNWSASLRYTDRLIWKIFHSPDSLDFLVISGIGESC